jgi:F0F1-type ATP synthase assembly protein I
VSDDLASKRAMNKGFSDAYTRSFELAVTPLLFGALGWLVDRWLGTGPWFMIGIAAFAMVGTVAKLWFTYEQAMRVEEEKLRLRRTGATEHPA